MRPSLLALALALACGSPAGQAPPDGGSPGDGGPDAGGPDAGAGDAGTPDGGSLVAARPYALHVPPSYDPAKPAPLVILLHGYGATGAQQESYFNLTPLADARTFLYATPDGTLDPTGHRYWNATDACCAPRASPVDDVAYINAIIDDVERRYTVDTKRVYLVGHSNGGFMAHRLACDSAPRIAAIVSLAGAQWKDNTRCAPGAKVAVLQVHGTADGTISYTGGSTPYGPYPAASETVADWARFNGCGSLDSSAPNLHIDSSQPPAETTVGRYTGCAGGAVELWSIQGGGHIPLLVPEWPALIYGFLSAHPRP